MEESILMKRTAYRSTDFNDERKWKRYHQNDDVLQVGKQKAIGYIFTRDSKRITAFEKLFIKFRNQGKFVALFNEPYPQRNVSIAAGLTILWVGDPNMMQSILNKKKFLLKKNHWSSDANKFFNRIIKTKIRHEKNPAMYHLICQLFNSWCLWCEPRPTYMDNGEILSQYPFDPDKRT